MKLKLSGTIGVMLALSLSICALNIISVDSFASTRVVHSGDDEDADFPLELEWHNEIEDKEVFYGEDLDYTIRFTSFEYVKDPHNYHIYYPQVEFKDKRNAKEINKILRDRACLISDKMYPKFTYDESLDRGRNESTVTYEITYMDNDYLSVIYYNDYFIGSTFSEYHDTYSCTIDLNKKERISVGDVFKNDKKFGQLLFDKVIKDDKRLAKAPEFEKEIMDELIETAGTRSRYMLGIAFTKDGFVLPFSFHYGDGNLIYRGGKELRFNYYECVDFMKDKGKWGRLIPDYPEITKKKKSIGFFSN